MLQNRIPLTPPVGCSQRPRVGGIDVTSRKPDSRKEEERKAEARLTLLQPPSKPKRR